MNFKFNIFIYIAFVEFILVLLVVIITYIFYFYFYWKNKIKDKYIDKIKEYIFETKENMKFSKKWINLSYLIPVLQLEKKAKKLTSPSWKLRRSEIIEKNLLPLARKKANSRYWLSRYLATKAFQLYVLPEDEPIIQKLLQDKSYSVFIEAERVVINLPTESLINIIIDKISSYDRKAYDFYLSIFRKMPRYSRKIIVDRLNIEDNLKKRLICYKILLSYKPEPLMILPENDLYSDNINLSISAIRFIFYSKKQLPLTLLQQLLKDKRWQIKVVVLQEISIRKIIEMVETVASLLDDEIWWVRLNAALALKDLGLEGVNMLYQLQEVGQCLGLPEVNRVLEDMTSNID